MLVFKTPLAVQRVAGGLIVFSHDHPHGVHLDSGTTIRVRYWRYTWNCTIGDGSLVAVRSDRPDQEQVFEPVDDNIYECLINHKNWEPPLRRAHPAAVDIHSFVNDLYARRNYPLSDRDDLTGVASTSNREWDIEHTPSGSAVYARDPATPPNWLVVVGTRNTLIEVTIDIDALALDVDAIKEVLNKLGERMPRFR